MTDELPEAVPPQASEIFGAAMPVAERYVRLLATAGVERGLIGPREVPGLWERHVLNCAVIADAFPGDDRLVDRPGQLHRPVDAGDEQAPARRHELVGAVGVGQARAEDGDGRVRRQGRPAVEQGAPPAPRAREPRPCSGDPPSPRAGTAASPQCHRVEVRS